MSHFALSYRIPSTILSRCSEDFEPHVSRLPRAGKRLPGVHSCLMSKAFGKILPMACVLRGIGFTGARLFDEENCNRNAIASRASVGHRAQDGFEPASTNVWGAAYPRVDAGWQGRIPREGPNASKVQVNFWGAAKLGMAKQPDEFWTVTSGAAGTRLPLLHGVSRRRGIQ